MNKNNIKKIVKNKYSEVALQENSCCGCTCTADNISKNIGYTDDEINEVPEGANLGLGCGNPVALASIKNGDVVLDLGSGAGFDCFLASSKVGENGRVIGVDMTTEMIEKARVNAKKGNYSNVEFKHGEIENIPVDNNSIDVIISNCVINLSPDKLKVFNETFRVLKPGGRLIISDIVLVKDLPEFIKKSIEAYVGCVAGAIKKSEYLELIRNVGFSDAEIIEESIFPIDFIVNDPNIQMIMKKESITLDQLNEVGDMVLSIKVKAIKKR